MSLSQSRRSTLLAFWGGRGRASGCASCATMLPSVGWCSTHTGVWLSCCRTWVRCFLSIYGQGMVLLLLSSTANRWNLSCCCKGTYWPRNCVVPTACHSAIKSYVTAQACAFITPPPHREIVTALHCGTGLVNTKLLLPAMASAWLPHKHQMLQSRRNLAEMTHRTLCIAGLFAGMEAAQWLSQRRVHPMTGA